MMRNSFARLGNHQQGRRIVAPVALRVNPHVVELDHRCAESDLLTFELSDSARGRPERIHPAEIRQLLQIHSAFLDGELGASGTQRDRRDEDEKISGLTSFIVATA